MASTSHQATLQDQGLRNWVRAGIGLKYTKEGLESFIDGEAVEFHSSLVKKLKHSTNLTSDLKKEIVSAHRFKDPSWKNSDQSKWSKDHWELAKNFLPNTGGYKSISSAACTDCSGLLNIGINLSEIANRHSIQLSKDGPTDFCKCRSTRNEILHCATQSLTDTKLKDYITVMKDTLQCTAALQNDTKAQQAVAKLTQLESSAFEIIDENITEVIQMARLAMEIKGKEEVEAVRAEGKKQKQDMLSSCKQAKRKVNADFAKVANKQRKKMKINTKNAIKKTQDECNKQVEAMGILKEKLIHEVRDESSSQVGVIKEEVEKQTQSIVITRIQEEKRIAAEGDKQREALKSDVEMNSRVAAETIQDKGNQQVEAVNMAGENQIQKIHKIAKTQVDASYQEEKNKLKSYLIKTYKARLQQDKQAEIDRLYLQPSMELVSKGTNRKAVEIEEIFFQEQTEFSRIYISGDAGHGKTALCRMLVLAWCQEHSGENISKYIPDGFLAVMKEFAFIFYITLRNFKKAWIISEIIKKQYFEDQNFYSKFIKNEGDKRSCLVILDGLDEWDPPSDYDTPMHTTDGLPDLRHVERFTILTTTRPWKLEVLRLVEPEIDRQVCLLGFSLEASTMYIEYMVKLLNMTAKSKRDFEYQLNVKKLTHLQKIPILLKQLIMLWHDDEKEIAGSTQIKLYSAMINHLLKNAWVKNKKKPLSVGNTPKSELPSCLGEKQYCKIHKDLLFSLAHLAFKSSFKGNLIFDHVEATLENLNEDDIQSCLKAGLLSQEMYESPQDDEKKQYSFLHKSFQDFLAAVYLAMDHESAQLPQTCNTMQKILDMRSLFIFVSGIDSSVMASLSHRIQVILESDEKVKQYLSETELYRLEPIQNLFCKCLMVSKENKQPIPCCHLEFINIHEEAEGYQDWKNLSKLIRINTHRIKHLRIIYEEDYPSDGYLKCLRDVSRCKTVQNLNLVITEELPIDIENLFHEAFSNYRSLSVLKLLGSGCGPFCEHLYFDRDATFINVDISDVEISSREEYVDILKSLEKNVQLTNLVLHDICYAGKVTLGSNTWQSKSIHHLDLSQCSQLQEISLTSCFSTKVTINITSLIYCRVDALPVKFVPHVGSPLQKMDLFDISCRDSLHDIATILPSLTCLSHLNLKDLDFHDEDVHLSPESSYLEEVKLENIMMTGTAMNRFLASIPATCQRVDLMYDCVSESLLVRHIDILSHLTSVTHLTLNFYNDYGDDDDDDDDDEYDTYYMLAKVQLTDRSVIKLLDSILASNHEFNCVIDGLFNEAVLTHIASKFVMLKSNPGYGYPKIIFNATSSLNF